MIRTTAEVAFNLVNPTETAIIYAEVYKVERNDKLEKYKIFVREFYKKENIIPTHQVVDNEIVVIDQIVIADEQIRRMERELTFAEADALSDYLDTEFDITETGSARRKAYTILGHLVTNNLEEVRGVTWELVAEEVEVEEEPIEEDPIVEDPEENNEE